MLGKWRAARFCIAAFLITVILLSNSSVRAISYAAEQAQTLSFAENVSPSNSTLPAVVGFSPSNIADLAITSPQNVSFTITVTNSTPIDGFAVFLHYNEQVLRVNTINYGDNVLGSKADVIEECVDHNSLVQGGCTPLDNLGIISLTLSLLGSAVTPTNTTGILFQINFSVFGRGFSALHILQAVLANGNTGMKVPLTTSDAYFTNIDCPRGSGNLCTPPVVSFSYSPIPSFIFRSVTFNSSASRATNLQANIAFLTWDFGDSGASQNSTSDSNGRPIPSTRHTYGNTCNCSATLAVVDSYGITAYATVVVQVISVYIDLLVNGVSATPQFRVLPGANVVIGVVVVNNSTFPEDGTIVIDVEGHVIGTAQSYHLEAFRQRTTISTNWNTSGYAPRVYRIDAVIPSILNENKTSNNQRTAFVQLISQSASGLLSLSLLQTGGLSIIILAGVLFGVSRFLRRKPSFEEDDYGSK